MNSKGVVSAVISLLSTSLPDIAVAPEFSNIKQNMPLQSPIITVGTERIVITADAEAGVVSTGSSESIVTVRLSLCAPKRFTGLDCSYLSDRTVEALRKLLDMYFVIGMEIGDIKYSSTLSALVSEIKITVDYGNAY